MTGWDRGMSVTGCTKTAPRGAGYCRRSGPTGAGGVGNGAPGTLLRQPGARSMSRPTSLGTGLRRATAGFAVRRRGFFTVTLRAYPVTRILFLANFRKLLKTFGQHIKSRAQARGKMTKRQDAWPVHSEPGIACYRTRCPNRDGHRGLLTERCLRRTSSLVGALQTLAGRSFS